MWRFLVLSALLALAGCASRPPAPVAERAAPTVIEGGPGKTAEPAGLREGYYVVKKGDTLRKIAAMHGQDWRQVAAWNNLTDPGRIEIGQELRIAPPGATATTAASEGAVVTAIAVPVQVVVSEGAEKPPTAAAPSVTRADGVKREPKGGTVPYAETALAQVKAMEGGGAVVVAKPETPAVATAPLSSAAAASAAGSVEWTWPVAGKIVKGFVERAPGDEHMKGIEIAGRMGEPIQAAAAGTVAYIGTLHYYGDFLIVRHDNGLMSVYAHTSRILVKKDQGIAKGQKIAEMGNSGTDQPQLGFEVRQSGKPVDPLKFLPAR
jgi:lipoprotein NlpD